MTAFEEIRNRALANKGGKAALDALMPQHKTAKQLVAVGDDRYLSQMTRCVFQAGFNWKVIENKWDGFEEVFHRFDPARCAFLNDEELEAIGRDKRVVRNMQKIVSVPANARFILDIAKEHGSFGKFVAGWPSSDLVGLWAVLKKRATRLGGNSGQYFLRFVGKDAFILARDTVACLKGAGVVSTDNPTSARDLAAVQAAFNAWHEETGLPYGHLSRIASASIP
jgi:3-methyladenine DNA glycosylase Tag